MAQRPPATIFRRPQVLGRSGDSRSTLYHHMSQGLWTPPVKIGARAVGWPEHEVEALVAARIAGQNDAQIRELVKTLIASRRAYADALPDGQRDENNRVGRDTLLLDRDDDTHQVNGGRTRETREAERTAAVAQVQNEHDVQVLRLVAGRPDLATSQDTIRATLGVRKAVVSTALARLIRQRYVLPPARAKQPYTVTDQGRAALLERRL
jgi:prophage regulatory protein